MVDTTDAAERMATGENYENYTHAMHLHSLGFSLIPVSRTSKRPIVKWKRYQAEQCSTADVLEWFGRMGCRIGIVTGEISGIVVVDCDDLDAIDVLLDNSCEGGLDESMQKQRTRRGVHFFYTYPGTDTRNGRGFLGANIDVRGDGGYVVAYEDSGSFTRQGLDTAPTYEPLTR